MRDCRRGDARMDWSPYSFMNSFIMCTYRLICLGSTIYLRRAGILMMAGRRALSILFMLRVRLFYGSNKKVPYSTDDKVDNPVLLYAATKKSNELMAHAYSKL